MAPLQDAAEGAVAHILGRAGVEGITFSVAGRLPQRRLRQVRQRSVRSGPLLDQEARQARPGVRRAPAGSGIRRRARGYQLKRDRLVKRSRTARQCISITSPLCQGRTTQ
jgi:hypothetical protein